MTPQSRTQSMPVRRLGSGYEIADTLGIFCVDSEEFLYRFYNYRILHFSSEFNKNLENGEYSSDDVGCVNQK